MPFHTYRQYVSKAILLLMIGLSLLFLFFEDSDFHTQKEMTGTVLLI